MLEPGQIFAARYRIQRRISEGGMGAIFEAEHTGTERRVALKLLFPHIMSVASARAKFELEAKVSARVNSPYIVDVLDAGFDEATRSPYLVMELLSGDTLAAYVREQGRLGASEALALLRQVASGLDAAHRYKEPSGSVNPIVHRDLKPENLFVTRPQGGSPLVKILDFGIAKVLGDTGNVSQEVRGTPLYMAFEQVTAGALSPQTDVWALGLIAYHMLTGRRYWRSAEQPGAGVQSLFAEILNLPMEAPSARLAQQGIALELPSAFDAWLLRCLEREPSARFASAGLAIEELARVFEPAPRLGAAPAAPRWAPSSGSGATQTFQALAPPAPSKQALPSSSGAQRSPGERARESLLSATAGSLPAIASARGSLHPSSKLQAGTLAGVIGAGLIVVAAAVWFLGDRGASTRAERPAIESTGATATKAVSAAASPSPSVSAAASPSPSVGAAASPSPSVGAAAPELAVSAAASPSPPPQANPPEAAPGISLVGAATSSAAPSAPVVAERPEASSAWAEPAARRARSRGAEKRDESKASKPSSEPPAGRRGIEGSADGSADDESRTTERAAARRTVAPTKSAPATEVTGKPGPRSPARAQPKPKSAWDMR